MALATVSLLAIGLAMDATAVAATRGAMSRERRWRGAARVGRLFGGVQGLMPLAGWLLGDRLGSLFAAWDHWIASGR
jgi:manganese efflux pump family protein